MAWVESRKLAKGTTYHVVYELKNGSKRKITGFSDKRLARGFADKLTDLMKCNHKEFSAQMENWLDGLADDVHAQLASDGLIKPRVVVGTLKDLVKIFLEGELAQDLKESTLISRRTCSNRWLRFWGNNRSVADFTRSDAKKYMEFCKENYSEATWSREIKSIKLIFNYAVEELHWLKENPFRKLKGGSQSNRDKLHDVTLEETRAILNECPNAEMRLIFCLARFGGLRIPSELKFLDWECVNFDRNTLTIYVPKKTHKKAQEMGEFETRVIPLWPELREAFTEYWETLPEGAPNLVFPDCQTGQALKSRFRKILKRAGIPMWEKFFQSMRSTRATELRNKLKFSPEKVNFWIGHTEEVAERHYIQNTAESMQEASSCTTLNSVGDSVGETVGVRGRAQSISQNCVEKQEIKKSLENTVSNQCIKKGVASLQPPILTSSGFPFGRNAIGMEFRSPRPHLWGVFSSSFGRV